MAENDDELPGRRKDITLLWPAPDEAAPGKPPGEKPGEEPGEEPGEAGEPQLRTGSGSYSPSSSGKSARLADGALLNHSYRGRGLIARGGMAEVYQGVNALTDEHVAIKVILPHLADDPTVEAMFLREARTLLRLSHPALVSYRLAARDPIVDVLYLVTEFVDGVALDEAMEQQIRPSVAESIALTRRLADGLAAAHALGAIHRDLSPDNILLPGGRLEDAKIIDFGIAKDIATNNPTLLGNAFAGKLNYVAPEQLGDFGRHIGPWTDVYSLGLVMLAVASGREVDMGESLVEAVDRRRAGPDLSAAPEMMRPVFERMLQGDPEKRLRSMQEVIEALQAAQAPKPAPPPAPAATPAPLPPAPPPAALDVSRAPPPPAEPVSPAAASGPVSAAAAAWNAVEEPPTSPPAKPAASPKTRVSARKTAAPAAPPEPAPAPEPVAQAAPPARRRTTTIKGAQGRAAASAASAAQAPGALPQAAPREPPAGRQTTRAPRARTAAPRSSQPIQTAPASPRRAPTAAAGAAHPAAVDSGLNRTVRMAAPWVALVALVLLGGAVALLVIRPSGGAHNKAEASSATAHAGPSPATGPVVIPGPAPSATASAAPSPAPGAPPSGQASVRHRHAVSEAARLDALSYASPPAAQATPAPAAAPPPPVAAPPPPAPTAEPPRKKNIFSRAIEALKPRKLRDPATASPPPAPAPANPSPGTGAEPQ